jgi:hypothetical protein
VFTPVTVSNWLPFTRRAAISGWFSASFLENPMFRIKEIADVFVVAWFVTSQESCCYSG